MKALYLKDTTLFECDATVADLGQTEHGNYLVLDETVFYPQGGGQPSDRGTISSTLGTAEITKVVSQEGTILHYLSGPPAPFQKGDRVHCKVDSVLRLAHASAHTAGHLIASCVEVITQTSENSGLVAKKGFHFLEGPYVEFEGAVSNFASDAEFLAALNARLQSEIAAALPIQAVESPAESQAPGNVPGFRTVQMGSYSPVPCGGTHLKSLDELASITATKIKKTKTGLRVSYTFERKS